MSVLGGDSTKRRSVDRDAVAGLASGAALQDATHAVRMALDGLHRQRTVDAIVGVDERGCFPPAAVEPVLPVVVDANVLRNDIAYACRHEESRTILVNAANAGFLRLFCADHVVGEVAEHFEEWSMHTNIDPARFEAVWVTHYLPLLRVVRTLPVGLMSRDEQRRVEDLVSVDPDDVPSVVLTLLVGGFYLSQDGPATTAVYGHARPQAELRQWRGALAAGGDAGAIFSVFEASYLSIRLVGMGLGGMFSAIRGLPAWLQGAIIGTVAAGGTHAWASVDADRAQGLRDAVDRMLYLVAAVVDTRQVAIARVEDVCAPAPTVEALVEELTACQVLTRACLHQLARARSGVLSAAQLAEALPDELAVAKGESRVREALRSQLCARQPKAGFWQVGEPISWPRDRHPSA